MKNHKISKLSMRTIITALGSTLFVSGCGSLPTDPSQVHGTPTIGLVAYVSQVKFSHDVCAADVDSKASNRFHGRIIKHLFYLDHYRKYFPEFEVTEGLFEKQYEKSWDGMSTDLKQTFCTGYNTEIEWSKSAREMTVFKVLNRFRSYFSPLSQDYIKRSNNLRMLSGLFSLGLSATNASPLQRSLFEAPKHMPDYNKVDPVPCKGYAPFLDLDYEINHDFFSSYQSIIEC